MSRQTTNVSREPGSSIHESAQWFLASALFLAMLLSNYSPALGIPSWLFYTAAFVFLILLAMLSPSWRAPLHRTAQPTRNLGRIFLYISFFLVAVEVVWFGFVQQNWQLVAVLLPGTLAVGVFLYLAIAAMIERGLPLRFIVVPIASLLLGGLIGTLIRGLGYINIYVLSFAILSLGTGLWLRFRPENDYQA